MSNIIYDVIIIGAGPAGLSSAIYALRSNLKTLIIEKSTPGGQLVNINKISNYPGYIDGDGNHHQGYESMIKELESK